jgi:hypothetical protein
MAPTPVELGSELTRALSVWGMDSAEMLLESVTSAALQQVKKIDDLQNGKGKGKKNKQQTPIVRSEGDAALTAFEGIRWFVMASDSDLSLEGEGDGSGGLLHLKGVCCTVDNLIQPLVYSY